MDWVLTCQRLDTFRHSAHQLSMSQISPMITLFKRKTLEDTPLFSRLLMKQKLKRCYNPNCSGYNMGSSMFFIKPSTFRSSVALLLLRVHRVQYLDGCSGAAPLAQVEGVRGRPKPWRHEGWIVFLKTSWFGWGWGGTGIRPAWISSGTHIFFQ